MQNNLFDYIKNIQDKDAEVLDLIKYNIAEKIYYYGDHFKKTRRIPKSSFWLKAWRNYIYIILKNKLSKDIEYKYKGISSAYNNVDILIEDNGYYAERMPHSLKKGRKTVGGWKLYWSTINIIYSFTYRDYNYLISEIFKGVISDYEFQIKKNIQENDYKFLLVPNDIDFFPRVLIKAFKEFNRPTVLVGHGGMPSLYDKIMDNGTDFVALRGRKEVESFIKMGFDSEKFFITGHPFYKEYPKTLKFGLDDILVITKSVNGVCPLDKPHLEDRGNSILYLFSIQNVLKTFNISSVRLRPHPSENPEWYMKYINSQFFIIDTDSLSASLIRSTLVIGPTSTMIIDSMAHSVNYLIYEPIIDGKLLTGFPINPPLDGSDARIPIARDEEQLKNIIEEQHCIDLEVYGEFASPHYDVSFMDKIFNDQ